MSRFVFDHPATVELDLRAIEDDLTLPVEYRRVCRRAADLLREQENALARARHCDHML